MEAFYKACDLPDAPDDVDDDDKGFEDDEFYEDWLLNYSNVESKPKLFCSNKLFLLKAIIEQKHIGKRVSFLLPVLQDIQGLKFLKKNLN